MSASAQRFARDERMRGHGPTEIEAVIMDLYDRGLNTAAIASAVGRSPRHVQSVVGFLRISGNEDRLIRAAAATGSAQLLAAQLRAGQHCLSPAMATALRAAIGTGA